MWPLLAGAALSAGASIFGGRRQQSAANAQAASQMQFERENMFHQNQVALDMSREQNAFNSNEAAVARNWNAGQAQEARDWNATQSGIERTFNAGEAAKNRDFQEQMSNTQYQRATKDMMAAGINPMLAVSQGGAGNVSGSSASTSAPSTAPAQGSQASGSAASPAGLARGAQAQQFNYLASGISTAASVGQTIAGLEKLREETRYTSAKADQEESIAEGGALVMPDGSVKVLSKGLRQKVDTMKAIEGWRQSREQTSSAASHAVKAKNEADASQYDPEMARLTKELMGFEIPRAKNEANFEKQMEKVFQGFGGGSTLDRIMKVVLPLLMNMSKPDRTTNIYRR